MNEAMVDRSSITISTILHRSAIITMSQLFRAATGTATKSSRAKMSVGSTKVAIGSKEGKARATETAAATAAAASI